jgi:hypothetical protein
MLDGFRVRFRSDLRSQARVQIKAQMLWCVVNLSAEAAHTPIRGNERREPRSPADQLSRRKISAIKAAPTPVAIKM